VFTAVGAQSLPRGTRVRVQITGTDLITLEVHGRVLSQLDMSVPAAQSATEAEEEEDAAGLAAPISVAVDSEDAQAATEPTGTDEQAS
jgi:exoribonuclease-2